MSKKRKLEFKGLTNLSDIEDQMLTDLFNYRATLTHPKLKELFDEVVQEQYSPDMAEREGVMWGTGDGLDTTPAEFAIIDNQRLTDAQKLRALKKLRASWGRRDIPTEEDRKFALELRIPNLV